MSFTKFITAASFVALAACAGTTAQQAPATATPLATEAAFRTAIVGKTIGFDGSSFTVNADNTISGPWDGSGITGTWYWEDQYWCREVAIGGIERGLDCQVWTVDGSSATVARDRGNASSFTYTIS